jgi:hypothetical protein
MHELSWIDWGYLEVFFGGYGKLITAILVARFNQFERNW